MNKSLGQVFTPPSLAKKLASFFDLSPSPRLRLLDAGAGTGALTAAFVDRIIESETVSNISVVCYEIDSSLHLLLEKTLRTCQKRCAAKAIVFECQIRDDFLDPTDSVFDYAILNPPYKKIGRNSREYKRLQALGIKTTNLYAGFIQLAIERLVDGGQIVAITPRSFCNGSYFLPFRQYLVSTSSIKRIHLFGKRNKLFSEVLQENIIFHAVKTLSKETGVVITSSDSVEEESSILKTSVDNVVNMEDKNLFIRLPKTETDIICSNNMRKFKNNIKELGILVSTGKVVEFRVKQFLRQQPDENTYPLIYPSHLQYPLVDWPIENGRKPNAILRSQKNLLSPSGYYVLVKRITSKEEKKRIVAVMISPMDYDFLAFENHLNYFYKDNKGLDLELARGLTLFLNSTTTDSFFRQLSGSTQVNATDLSSLPYPSLYQLQHLGKSFGNNFPSQEDVDKLVNNLLEV